MNKVLKTELLERLRHTENFHNSPRLYHLYMNIQQTETQIELCRMFVNYFVETDKDLTTLTNELIDCRATSTYIKPMFSS